MKEMDVLTIFLKAPGIAKASPDSLMYKRSGVKIWPESDIAREKSTLSSQVHRFD
jgi:hypothetical protein